MGNTNKVLLEATVGDLEQMNNSISGFNSYELATFWRNNK